MTGRLSIAHGAEPVLIADRCDGTAPMRVADIAPPFVDALAALLGPDGSERFFAALEGSEW